MVSRLRRAMRRAARAAGPDGKLPGGLSVAQLELLSCLAERPGLRPGELARMLRLAASSVATLLNGLQGAGHVTRTSSASDRRGVTLHLTQTGQAAVVRWQQLNEQIIGTALGTLPPRSQAALQHATGALHDLTSAIDALAD